MTFDPNKKWDFEIKEIITSFSEGDTPREEQLPLIHKHKNREFFFVLQGESNYFYNNFSYKVTPGTAVFVDSWKPHAMGYTKYDKDLFHLWFHLDQTGELYVSPIYIGEYGDFYLNSPVFKMYPEYSILISRRWNTLLSQENANQQMAEKYLREPMVLILEEIALNEKELNSYKPTSSKQITIEATINSLKRYIKNRNARDCSLTKLEKFTGYDRFYLSHNFKQFTGQTIGDFINKVRWEYTQAALQAGMTQKKISQELGFSSPSTFWNWLQKIKK